MSENGTVLTLQVVDLVIGGVGIAVVVFFGCYTYYQYKLMRKWFDQEKTIFKQQQVLFEKQQEELKIQEQMRIPVKSIGCSGGRRSPVPLDADHSFRRVSISRRSEATLAVI